MVFLDIGIFNLASSLIDEQHDDFDVLLILNIEKIISVCTEYGIDYKNTVSVFKCKPSTIRGIAEICRSENIEVTGSIFFSSPQKLKDNIDFDIRVHISTNREALIVKFLED
mgnify:CR=1 FL=1